MKRLIFISSFLSLAVCSISQSTPKADTVNSYKLLQGTNHGSYYILLNDDTAFFQRILKGKPPRFVGFDTLILNQECNCLKGKRMQFLLNERMLTFTNGPIKGSIEYFKIADEKGKKRWELQINDEYWRHNYMKYDSLWKSRKAKNLSNVELYKDWGKLMSLSLTLHPEEFKEEFSKFIAKYSYR